MPDTPDGWEHFEELVQHECVSETIARVHNLSTEPLRHPRPDPLPITLLDVNPVPATMGNFTAVTAPAPAAAPPTPTPPTGEYMPPPGNANGLRSEYRDKDMYEVETKGHSFMGCPDSVMDRTVSHNTEWSVLPSYIVANAHDSSRTDDNAHEWNDDVTRRCMPTRLMLQRGSNRFCNWHTWRNPGPRKQPPPLVSGAYANVDATRRAAVHLTMRNSSVDAAGVHNITEEWDYVNHTLFCEDADQTEDALEYFIDEVVEREDFEDKMAHDELPQSLWLKRRNECYYDRTQDVQARLFLPEHWNRSFTRPSSGGSCGGEDGSSLSPLHLLAYRSDNVEYDFSMEERTTSYMYEMANKPHSGLKPEPELQYRCIEFLTLIDHQLKQDVETLAEDGMMKRMLKIVSAKAKSDLDDCRKRQALQRACLKFKLNVFYILEYTRVIDPAIFGDECTKQMQDNRARSAFDALYDITYATAESMKRKFGMNPPYSSTEYKNVTDEGVVREAIFAKDEQEFYKSLHSVDMKKQSHERLVRRLDKLRNEVEAFYTAVRNVHLNAKDEFLIGLNPEHLSRELESMRSIKRDVKIATDSLNLTPEGRMNLVILLENMISRNYVKSLDNLSSLVINILPLAAPIKVDTLDEFWIVYGAATSQNMTHHKNCLDFSIAQLVTFSSNVHEKYVDVHKVVMFLRMVSHMLSVFRWKGNDDKVNFLYLISKKVKSSEAIHNFSQRIFEMLCVLFMNENNSIIKYEHLSFDLYTACMGVVPHIAYHDNLRQFAEYAFAGLGSGEEAEYNTQVSVDFDIGPHLFGNTPIRLPPDQVRKFLNGKYVMKDGYKYKLVLDDTLIHEHCALNDVIKKMVSNGDIRQDVYGTLIPTEKLLTGDITLQILKELQDEVVNRLENLRSQVIECIHEMRSTNCDLAPKNDGLLAVPVQNWMHARSHLYAYSYDIEGNDQGNNKMRPVLFRGADGLHDAFTKDRHLVSYKYHDGEMINATRTLPIVVPNMEHRMFVAMCDGVVRRTVLPDRTSGNTRLRAQHALGLGIDDDMDPTERAVARFMNVAFCDRNKGVIERSLKGPDYIDYIDHVSTMVTYRERMSGVDTPTAYRITRVDKQEETPDGHVEFAAICYYLYLCGTSILYADDHIFSAYNVMADLTTGIVHKVYDEYVSIAQIPTDTWKHVLNVENDPLRRNARHCSDKSALERDLKTFATPSKMPYMNAIVAAISDTLGECVSKPWRDEPDFRDDHMMNVPMFSAEIEWVRNNTLRAARNNTLLATLVAANECHSDSTLHVADRLRHAQAHKHEQSTFIIPNDKPGSVPTRSHANAPPSRFVAVSRDTTSYASYVNGDIHIDARDVSEGVKHAIPSKRHVKSHRGVFMRRVANRPADVVRVRPSDQNSPLIGLLRMIRCPRNEKWCFIPLRHIPTHLYTDDDPEGKVLIDLDYDSDERGPRQLFYFSEIPTVFRFVDQTTDMRRRCEQTIYSCRKKAQQRSRDAVDMFFADQGLKFLNTSALLDRKSMRDEYYVGPFNPWCRAHGDNGCAGVFQGSRMYMVEYPFSNIGLVQKTNKSFSNYGRHSQSGERLRLVTMNSERSSVWTEFDSATPDKRPALGKSSAENMTRQTRVASTIDTDNRVREREMYGDWITETEHGGLLPELASRMDELVVRKRPFADLPRRSESSGSASAHNIDSANRRSTMSFFGMYRSFGTVKTIHSDPTRSITVPSAHNVSLARPGNYFSCVSMMLNAHASVHVSVPDATLYYSVCDLIQRHSLSVSATPTVDLIHGFQKRFYAYPLYYEQTLPLAKTYAARVLRMASHDNTVQADGMTFTYLGMDVKDVVIRDEFSISPGMRHLASSSVTMSHICHVLKLIYENDFFRYANNEKQIPKKDRTFRLDSKRMVFDTTPTGFFGKGAPTEEFAHDYVARSVMPNLYNMDRLPKEGRGSYEKAINKASGILWRVHDIVVVPIDSGRTACFAMTSPYNDLRHDSDLIKDVEANFATYRYPILHLSSFPKLQEHVQRHYTAYSWTDAVTWQSSRVAPVWCQTNLASVIGSEESFKTLLKVLNDVKVSDKEDEYIDISVAHKTLMDELNRALSEFEQVKPWSSYVQTKTLYWYPFRRNAKPLHIAVGSLTDGVVWTPLHGRRSLPWDEMGIGERMKDGLMDLVGGKERLAYSVGAENVCWDDDVYELKWWRYVFVNMIALWFETMRVRHDVDCKNAYIKICDSVRALDVSHFNETGAKHLYRDFRDRLTLEYRKTNKIPTSILPDVVSAYDD